MPRLRVVYDGQCPFCSAYVKLARLRETVAVELVDARAQPEIAGSYDLDLNKGMIADLDGAVYHGAEAMWLLSSLSSRSGLLNSAVARLFANRTSAKIAYPLLRASRNASLKMLGRSKIE